MVKFVAFPRCSWETLEIESVRGYRGHGSIISALDKNTVRRGCGLVVGPFIGGG